MSEINIANSAGRDALVGTIGVTSPGAFDGLTKKGDKPAPHAFSNLLSNAMERPLFEPMAALQTWEKLF